jgi:hypothetical protein
MTSFEKLGRWLFVGLAGLSAIFALQLLLSRFRNPAVSGNAMPRIVWILIYLGAAIGIGQWKPWAYLMGILVAVASILSGLSGVSRGSHPLIDGVSLILWVLCLVWLCLPGVREKFKPVTS